MEDLARSFSQITLGADYTQNNKDFVLALEKNILEITLGKNLAHTRLVIGLKIEYPWIIHFSLILYSN